MFPIEPTPPLIPGYDVLRLIGKGGMGRVFLARQCSLERLVCIKLLPPELDSDPSERRERFEREARILASVSHPHILVIHDFGSLDDGSPFLVTEYVENGDLRKLAAAGPLPIPRLRMILGQIGRAVAHMHSRGILHRDLKPENILVPSEASVKVADFGLAVLENDCGRLTRSSQGIGTLVYAPPEQQAGGPVDARSDQYSLAAIAYEMLTNRRPISSLKPPSQVAPRLDHRHDAVLMKALSPDPAGRYARLEDFLEALDRVLAPSPAVVRRRASLLVGSLALAGGAAVLASRWEGADVPPHPPTAAPPRVESTEPSPEFHRLTEIRAREIWISQGSPVGEAGEAVSLANWLKAEAEVRDRVERRAFEIWRSQGSPRAGAGEAVRESNMRTAASQLLREAEPSAETALVPVRPLATGEGSPP